MAWFLAIGAGVAILLFLKNSSSSAPSKEKEEYFDITKQGMPPLPSPQSEKDDDIKDEEIEEAINEIEKEKLSSQDLNFNELLSPSPTRISNEAWRKYVKASITGKTGTISKGYNLGLFLMNMRTLEDFGYTKNVKKQSDGTWRGDWIAPYSLERFLKEPKLQYEAFLKMTSNHMSAIDGRHKSSINSEIEGKKVSLSGLLGVAKQAGLGGLAKWLTEDSSVRKSNTTKMYLRTNGIF